MRVCACGHCLYDHPKQNGCILCGCRTWTEVKFWRRTPWGYLHDTPEHGRWVIRRAPSFTTTRLYWIYHNCLRFSLNGRFEGSLSFRDARAAQKFVVDYLANPLHATLRL